MKCNTVVAVQKVNSPTRFKELQPITLMLLIDKILEVIVHECLNRYVPTYLKTNHVLYYGESGFRKKNSCETACHLVYTTRKNDIDEGT